MIKQANLPSELANQNTEYQKAIIVDNLTQILTRYTFDQYLEREWQRGLRNTQPLSFILASIDGFKGYGDTYDTATDRQVAQTIRNAVYRSSDLVCQYDDEEFAILLPNTSIEGAIYVATRIQNALKDAFQINRFSLKNQPITLSCGLSSLIPLPKVELTQFLKAAETALHNAKSKGRNRIEVHLFQRAKPLLDAEWLQPLSRKGFN